MYGITVTSFFDSNNSGCSIDIKVVCSRCWICS